MALGENDVAARSADQQFRIIEGFTSIRVRLAVVCTGPIRNHPRVIVHVLEDIVFRQILRRYSRGRDELACQVADAPVTEDDIGENGKLFRYDSIAINVVVRNSKGGINSCDIPYSADLQQFNRDYLELTTKVAKECQSSFLDGYMIVGTSAMIQTELDCIVNQYTDKFLNPMVMWGKYRKGLFKTTLPVSFQFHHVQMDGGDAARFLERLQRKIQI